jgi:hypothetical protein
MQANDWADGVFSHVVLAESATLGALPERGAAKSFRASAQYPTQQASTECLEPHFRTQSIQTPLGSYLININSHIVVHGYLQ